MNCSRECLENSETLQDLISILEKETQLTCELRKYTCTKERVSEFISDNKTKYYGIKAEVESQTFDFQVTWILISMAVISLINYILYFDSNENLKIIVFIILLGLLVILIWLVKKYNNEQKWKLRIKIALKEIWNEKFENKSP